MMRATLTRKSQKAEARRRSSKIWSDLETLREERRQSKAAPTTKRERVLEQLRARSLAVCESSKFMTFMTVLTLYALFGDDAKLCLADSTADDAFVVAAVVCIVMFGVEIVLQCFAYAWYFRGFYFWVDLASTLSILTEIPAVMAEVAILVGGSGGESAEMLKAGKVVSGVRFRDSYGRRVAPRAPPSPAPDGVGLARRYRRGDDASRRWRGPARRHRGAVA